MERPGLVKLAAFKCQLIDAQICCDSVANAEAIIEAKYFVFKVLIARDRIIIVIADFEACAFLVQAEDVKRVFNLEEYAFVQRYYRAVPAIKIQIIKS